MDLHAEGVISPDRNEGHQQHRRYASKVEFLHHRIDNFLNDFKGKRDASRDRAKNFTLVAIVSSSLLTVLLGVRSVSVLSKYEDLFTVVTLAMSAAITGMNSWIAFADYKWKWIRYRATLATLYTIKDDLDYLECSRGQLDEKQVDDIFEQLKRAVHETNQEWMSQRGNAITGLGSGKSSAGSK